MANLPDLADYDDEEEDDGGDLYLRQPCAACGESYVVKKKEAHWRNLCHPCYKARKGARPRCAECKSAVAREYMIGGLCVECLARETLRSIQRKSRKAPQPALMLNAVAEDPEAAEVEQMTAAHEARRRESARQSTPTRPRLRRREIAR